MLQLEFHVNQGGLQRHHWATRSRLTAAPLANQSKGELTSLQCDSWLLWQVWEVEVDTGVDFQISPVPLPQKKRSHPVPITQKNWGKIPSRFNPGRMTHVPSHYVVFLFGRNLSQKNKNKIQYRSQHAHFS